MRGRRVWGSRGWPTVEVEVELAGGVGGRSIATDGIMAGAAPTGTERRVDGALASLDALGPALRGLDAGDQAAVDARIEEVAASHLGLTPSTCFAASLAVAIAAARANRVPLWRHVRGERGVALPLPQVEVFGGGVHAGRAPTLQDINVVAVGAEDYAQALDWSARVYHAIGQALAHRGRQAGVTDKGGHWPAAACPEDLLGMCVAGIEGAGLIPGEDVGLVIDVAAAHLRTREGYRLQGVEGPLGADEFCNLLVGWAQCFPIVGYEDPVDVADEAAMVELTMVLGATAQLMTDDLTGSDPALITTAAERGAGNAAVVKPSRAGTVTRAAKAVDSTLAAGWRAVLSGQSGESEDSDLIHLAVGWGVGQLKVGSIVRSERTAKWNEGLRIAEQLAGGDVAPFRHLFATGPGVGH